MNGTTTYSYDWQGNRYTTTNGTTGVAYVPNDLNQYVDVNGIVPEYDPDGNLTAIPGTCAMAYDGRNQMTFYSNANDRVWNTYDHQGRRVLKVSHGGTETRRFIYDGWLPIAEIVETSTATTTNLFVWGKDLSGSQQGAGGIGGLLAVKQGNAWYFPLSDANGNITGYIDEQGTLVAEYTYDAFGGTISQSGSMDDAFAHRFSTKYYDSETGLYYYGYRFYSPYLHRWLNRDPIEEDGGLNLYGFCGNNGVNGVDPFGMSPSPVVLEEISGVILSFIFGDRIIHDATFMFYGGREEFINETGKQLYARGILAGKMWDRALSSPALSNGKYYGNALIITSANQMQWGDAIDLIKTTSIYREKVNFIKRRLKEGTSAKGFVNIEFENPDALASSIHGAQLHYNCSKCRLVLTIQDENNFDKKHIWWRLQKEGYIIPYNVFIVIPKKNVEEVCEKAFLICRYWSDLGASGHSLNLLLDLPL